MKPFKTFSLFAIFIVLLSCTKEEPKEGVDLFLIQDPFEIVRVVLFEDPNQTDSTVFTFNISNSGVSSPSSLDITLTSGVLYTGVIRLLTNSASGPTGVSHQIKSNATNYQFFFLENLSSTSFFFNDADFEGNPVGLKFSLNSTLAETGILDLVLLEKPNKDAQGVSSGDISNAGGSTLFSMRFNITMQ